MGNQVKRRPLKFENLPATVTEVRRLQEGGYDLAGNWDLAKACSHLSKTLTLSLEGSPFNLPFFMKPIARFLLFGKVMAGKQTGLPLKTDPALAPNDCKDATLEIENYEKLVQRVMDPNATLIESHPVFGKVTVEQWRTFHAWHAAHHLSYLIPKTSP